MKGQKLKNLFDTIGFSQGKICRQCGFSATSLSLLLNYGCWPVKAPEKMQADIVGVLKNSGRADVEITEALADIPLDNNIKPPKREKEEKIVMIRKQNLTPEAKRKFGIFREIFSEQLSDMDDVFLSPELRYVRESLYNMARFGGMMALIGESGSGKSTLRRDLISRLQREEARVIVIEPYVLGLDRNKDISKGLASNHICQAIIYAVSPDTKCEHLSAEALFRLTHRLLRESSRSGYKHLMIIEEAHCLTSKTIKQLKRFFELEDGLTRLLSILLIGQPELRTTLSETNAEVREVVQRMEMLQLMPLDDAPGYVAHRCERAGVQVADIFDPNALGALSQKLSGPASRNGGTGQSMLYPLMVGNLVTKAINLAAELKLPKVTAQTIMGA